MRFRLRSNAVRSISAQQRRGAVVPFVVMVFFVESNQKLTLSATFFSFCSRIGKDFVWFVPDGLYELLLRSSGLVARRRPFLESIDA